MRTRGSKSRSKMSPQNCQKLEISWEILRCFSPKIQFSSTAFQLSSTAFQLSSTAFCFPQWFSNFPQWLSTLQEIRGENLSMAASIQKIAIRASYFPPLTLQALQFPLQCLHLPQHCETIILSLVSSGSCGHSFRNGLVEVGTQHNQRDHVDTVPEKILVLEGLKPGSDGSDVWESLATQLDGVPNTPVLQGDNSSFNLAQGTVRV
jgi:hypothetical protein